MKHITPQAQNHIFKEKGRKPVPFQDISHGETGFITLYELKILEKKGKKNSMDSDSDSDDTSVSFFYSDKNEKNTETNDETNNETNDDTLTIDEKETYYEDELFEDCEEVNQSEVTDDGNDDRNDDGKNEGKEDLTKGFAVKKKKKNEFYNEL